MNTCDQITKNRLNLPIAQQFTFEQNQTTYVFLLYIFYRISFLNKRMKCVKFSGLTREAAIDHGLESTGDQGQTTRVPLHCVRSSPYS